jgi:hypothetical protein
VTLHAASDHRAVQHIKRGEQRGRAMAFIVVFAAASTVVLRYQIAERWAA